LTLRSNGEMRFLNRFFVTSIQGDDPGLWRGPIHGRFEQRLQLRHQRPQQRDDKRAAAAQQ
jgi:hypothetical protein